MIISEHIQSLKLSILRGEGDCCLKVSLGEQIREAYDAGNVSLVRAVFRSW